MGLMNFSFLPQSLGFHTNVAIIMPGEGEENRSYPVLYLLHGGAGNAQDWLRFTSIERYAEEHKLVVVMPEVGGSCFYGDMVHGYPYYTYLTQELPKVLECLLPIADNREKRFVAGLSMGGYGAFKWAFDQPDFFAAAANFSGFSFVEEIFDEKSGGFAGREQMGEKSICNLVWGGYEKLLGTKNDTRYMVTHALKSKANLPRLYAAIGTEDFSYEPGMRYLEFMKNSGIEVKYEEMPGAHEWKVWDTAIRNFIPWALAK